MGYKNK